METYNIYAIACPKTGDIKYVGRTSRDDVRKRVVEHYYSYLNKGLSDWLNSLNEPPKIILLCTADGILEGRDKEVFWIKSFSKRHKLFNKKSVSNYAKKVQSVLSAPIQILGKSKRQLS